MNSGFIPHNRIVFCFSLTQSQSDALDVIGFYIFFGLLLCRPTIVPNFRQSDLPVTAEHFRFSQTVLNCSTMFDDQKSTTLC